MAKFATFTLGGVKTASGEHPTHQTSINVDQVTHIQEHGEYLRLFFSRDDFISVKGQFQQVLENLTKASEG
jgi:hypothetical protein